MPKKSKIRSEVAASIAAMNSAVVMDRIAESFPEDDTTMFTSKTSYDIGEICRRLKSRMELDSTHIDILVRDTLEILRLYKEGVLHQDEMICLLGQSVEEMKLFSTKTCRNILKTISELGLDNEEGEVCE